MSELCELVALLSPMSLASSFLLYGARSVLAFTLLTCKS